MLVSKQGKANLFQYILIKKKEKQEQREKEKGDEYCNVIPEVEFLKSDIKLRKIYLSYILFLSQIPQYKFKSKKVNKNKMWRLIPQRFEVFVYYVLSK